MKHFLFLAAAAGFLPGLIIRIHGANIVKVPIDSVLTDLMTTREDIVNIHNAFRRAVHPSASNMLKMSWSDEAAKNANILSKYCDVTPSNPLKRRIKNTFCGENVYLTSYPVSWKDVIEIWYNESKNFKYGIPIEENGETIDHYLQLVWASSYLVGCAMSPCCNKLLPQYLYVCHYCHEGNEPEVKHIPYKTGAACNECPRDCEEKLCTNPCTYYDEYTDCNQRKMTPGCGSRIVQLQCKATCSCTSEIKYP